MLTSPWIRWGAVLGFGLGGFFDGILLHQILQWHHLLSLVPGMADLRTQVLWDGYFHALMYLITAAGLWGLWRAHRGAFAAPSTADPATADPATADPATADPPRTVHPATLAGALLIGFGLWHIVDGVLSHWWLGIHRIRLDSPNPLVWDVLWLIGFGIAPLLLGLALARARRSGTVRSRPPTALLLLLLSFASAAAGVWALQPPPGQPFTTVVFRADRPPQANLAALARTQARLLWSNPAMTVVVVQVTPAERWSLYRHGAMLVSGSGVPPGCFSWRRV